MLITKISGEKSSFYWITFHLVLGLLCTLSRLPLLIWFYIVLLSVLRQLFFGTRQLRQIAILKAMA